jgi:hypothetical protein
MFGLMRWVAARDTSPGVDAINHAHALKILAGGDIWLRRPQAAIRVLRHSQGVGQLDQGSYYQLLSAFRH